MAEPVTNSGETDAKLKRAASVHKPNVTDKPLRDVVFSGCFFGAAFRDNAERVASFLTQTSSGGLLDWFGPAHFRKLACDVEALQGVIDCDIAALDQLIAAQLDAVLHHPRMRSFEGSWRGLYWLTDGIDGGARTVIRVLSLSWNEICRDLERAADFDQSQLFRHIYEAEFGMPGGEPYGLLIVDHQIRHRPGRTAPTDDITALDRLAGVAAAAFAPLVIDASPALFGLDSFAELGATTDMVAPLRSPEYQRWRGLATREDARFIAVTLPRLLARAPWRDDPARGDGFRYAEYAPEVDCHVWMSAAYGFAAAVIRAFANFGWPAEVRGAQSGIVGGGLISGLPDEPFRSGPALAWQRLPLETVLTDTQERQLHGAGFMPVSALPFGTECVIAAVPSLQTPSRFTGAKAEIANANADLSAQLNAMLCVARFAHYLKVMGRDMAGSFKTADEIERELQRWLNRYVNASTGGGVETRARYPLQSGRVTVSERADKPGVFASTIHLQPHFQLDNVLANFRLTTNITAPSAAHR